MQTVKEIMETPLGPTQSVMATMNSTGDLKTIWDRTKPAEVDEARVQFDSMRRRGYMAYKVTDKGARGEVIDKFDPTAQSIILAPPMQGGF